MSILAVFKILSSLLFFIEGEVLFESIESKTSEDRPVFNKISLTETKFQDTWTMKQSHSGVNSHKWDHIQIIVDKSSRPYKASYHQLDSAGKEIEYKTSCFRCHANGPRYIRPKPGLKLKEKLTVLKWNMLIKSYGEVALKENNPFKRSIPFAHSSGEELKVQSCTSCHYKGGPRSELTSEHRNTIKHLVKNNQMPPWPYKMTTSEKNELKKFIYGF